MSFREGKGSVSVPVLVPPLLGSPWLAPEALLGQTLPAPTPCPSSSASSPSCPPLSPLSVQQPAGRAIPASPVPGAGRAGGLAAFFPPSPPFLPLPLSPGRPLALARSPLAACRRPFFVLPSPRLKGSLHRSRVQEAQPNNGPNGPNNGPNGRGGGGGGGRRKGPRRRQNKLAGSGRWGCPCCAR